MDIYKIKLQLYGISKGKIKKLSRKELIWWSSRGTLGLFGPLDTARLRSNHLEHLVNQSEDWKNDMHSQRERMWQV